MLCLKIYLVTQYSDLGGGETALLSLVDHLNPAEYLPHLLVPREGQLAAASRGANARRLSIFRRGAARQPTSFHNFGRTSHLPASSPT